MSCLSTSAAFLFVCMYVNMYACMYEYLVYMHTLTAGVHSHLCLNMSYILLLYIHVYVNVHVLASGEENSAKIPQKSRKNSMPVSIRFDNTQA